ncbi:diguanylate cyclase (GGDEF)-like protein [Clostridiales Family XIII bacterium PM5-7]
MQVGVGFSDNPDSIRAGKQAAKMALSNVEREDSCDLVLLFCTARHNQELLRYEVSEIVGNKAPVYGGGAVGIITNESFGYAGDQVGVACIWLDGSEINVTTELGLHNDVGETKTGERLGERLAAQGITKDSPVMLFYDAIDRSHGDVRMKMATWILEGLEKGLGFLPDLTGAGMQGDFVSSATKQFLGDTIGSGSAFALTFSDDISVDSVIMHGCRPASPYYTVTKADGPAILEINGQPAIPFIDSLLKSAITPDDYPFFLTFGINHGERWAAYDENNYASRLCLSIDKEKDAIIMFEADMIEGTEFQIMYRSMELDYMKPKTDALFSGLGDQEPIFAIYIDCAGRCAGYGGIDLEDAYVIQEATRNRVPLLGLYTGVEIASVAGRPRGLDWTGVLCVFSKKKGGEAAHRADVDMSVWDKTKTKDAVEETTPMDALVNINEENIAQVLRLGTSLLAIRTELEQKRRGFGLLSELSVSLQQENSNESVFLIATQRINATLNMQRTVVLFKDDEGKFTPSILQGYTTEEKVRLVGRHITLDEEILNPENMIIVTSADGEHRFADLRKTLQLPYFIAAPVVVENQVVAVLITGRMMESPPLLSPLSQGDAETTKAITSLLASVLMHQRLDDATKQAQTDELTQIFNRGAMEQRAMELLQEELPTGGKFAYMMIDFDFFKNVNDTYGHLTGDKALVALANTLKKHFRSTDIVARIGGDEFAVFCKLNGDDDHIDCRVAQLIKNWNETPIEATDGTVFHSTLSIGISVAPRDGVLYNELVHRADIALYKSKQNGRNQFTIYDKKTMDSIE